jgi:hypothetical protein
MKSPLTRLDHANRRGCFIILAVLVLALIIGAGLLALLEGKPESNRVAPPPVGGANASS